jgi:hypothetical protein
VAQEAGMACPDTEAALMIAVGGTGALVQAAMQWRLEGYATPRVTLVAAARRVLFGLAVPISGPGWAE